LTGAREDLDRPQGKKALLLHFPRKEENISSERGSKKNFDIGGRGGREEKKKKERIMWPRWIIKDLYDGRRIKTDGISEKRGGKGEKEKGMEMEDLPFSLKRRVSIDLKKKRGGRRGCLWEKNSSLRRRRTRSRLSEVEPDNQELQIYLLPRVFLPPSWK